MDLHICRFLCGGGGIFAVSFGGGINMFHSGGSG